MSRQNITGCYYVKRHKSILEDSLSVMDNGSMAEQGGPYSEQGRRLKLLRKAERPGWTGAAFAAWLGWQQSGYSQFESGKRRVPLDKASQLRRMIPGFDPVWLWEGDVERLGFDLRRRIRAEEAKEADDSSRSERQDV